MTSTYTQNAIVVNGSIIMTKGGAKNLDICSIKLNNLYLNNFFVLKIILNIYNYEI